MADLKRIVVLILVGAVRRFKIITVSLRAFLVSTFFSRLEVCVVVLHCCASIVIDFVLEYQVYMRCSAFLFFWNKIGFLIFQVRGGDRGG